MNEYMKIDKKLLKAILAEEIDEKIFSAQKNVTVNRLTLEEDTVPGDCIGLVIGIATNFDASTTYFVKVAEKDRYENGLTAAGLSEIAVGAGVGREVALMEYIKGGAKWKLEATRAAGAAVQNYRLRIWHIKKTSPFITEL